MSKARDIVETLRTVLVDGDIGTDVLAPDGDGSGLTGVDSLPSQTSQTGKFLTTNGSAASWGTVAPAGMVLLSTVTASSSSTVDIGDYFDSTYDSYIIRITSVRTSAGSYIGLRFKMGGSYLAGSGYRYSLQTTNTDSTNYTALSSPNISSIKIIAGGDLNSECSHCEIYLSDPTSTTLQKGIHWVGDGSRSSEHWSTTGFGRQNATTAYTGVRFIPDGGTILYGTFRLYGITK